MNTPLTIRTNVTLPADLVIRLKRMTPSRGLSKFLAEAAREKLVSLERDKALEELMNAPASFENIKDSVSYINKERSFDERREKRLGL